MAPIKKKIKRKDL